MKKDNKHRNMVLKTNRVKTAKLNVRNVKAVKKTINVEFD